MKIVVAFDSFKDCMRASEIADLALSALREIHFDGEIVTLPLADGGEGTVDALARSMDGEIVELTVGDPLGRPVKACCAINRASHSAILEMAAASGLELLKNYERNPLLASTYGTGEMIRQLIGQGIRDFTVGIGGSATVDGGLGMLQALGWRFVNDKGAEIPARSGAKVIQSIAAIDASAVDPHLAECKFHIACDVNNILTGPAGAAMMFGAQKGADKAMQLDLENQLIHWAKLWKDEGKAAGDGAAGGLGFAFRRILKGVIRPGAETVLDAIDFDRKIAGADLIVTGEGCSDEQTLHGKLCQAVNQRGKRHQIPVVLLSGGLRGDVGQLEKEFFAVMSLAAGPGTLEKAIADTPQNLRRMLQNIAKLYFNGSR